MTSTKRPPTPCQGSTDLFYGPHDDLRREPEEARKTREAKAELACGGCYMKMECLSLALLNKEKQGVWGGMATGKRREFLKFVKKHRKGNWRAALDDLKYLKVRSETFHKKEERRLAKVARERARSEACSEEVA